MCGFVGILNYGSSEAISSELIDSMRDEMSHRGPDDAGTYISPDGTLGLGHRRLSILDLSSAGHQPMWDEDGRIGIVYNGEIYNFMELRRDLEAAGYRFHSRSDTEVLLHLYQEHGFDMLDHLRGMFAFALWDGGAELLWLVRDRIGIKPLYYTFQNGQFLFASEIKAILKHPGVSRELNESAFYHYLSFLTTPAPETLFAGIKKLPPGYHMTVTARGAETLTRWWDVFDDVTPIADSGDESEIASRILDELRESIRYRMVSDVPFGVFLSGGIDSSLNVALMAELMDRPVQTFSVGYADQPGYNEFQHARHIAERFSADHHEITISAKDMVDFLPQLVFHQDEPISDPVCVPLYYVAKLAKDSGVSVCQVGEGSDELFCGYPHWVNLLRYRRSLERLGRLPGALPTAMAAMRLLGKGSGYRYEYLRRARMGETLFWNTSEAFRATERALLAPRSKGDSYEIIEPLRSRFLETAPDTDYLNWMSYADLKFRLPELLLMRVDKMTMATALEARVPFLDYKFVELVLSIPPTLKHKDGVPKYILKKAAERVLPHEIVHRPKQGFQVPVAEWFFQELGEYSVKKARDFVKQTPYFDSVYVERLIASKDALSLWFLLNFILWYELWLGEDNG